MNHFSASTLRKKFSLGAVGLVAFALLSQLSPHAAWAGFFTMPHFVSQDQFTVGLEPEVVFNQGGSLGMNLRYTRGISESSNLTGIFGTGSGTKGLRIGGAATFDVFPDAGKQPGVGFGAKGMLVEWANLAVFQATGFAYIHKSFAVTSDYVQAVEPFSVIPLGVQMGAGLYQWMSSISVGSIFQHSQHFRSVFEITVGINSSDTSISGGVAYYP